MPLPQATFHLLDFEGHRRYGVVEFGIVTVSGGAIAETRTALCRPSGDIPREDRELHGLGLRETAAAPPFADQWEHFLALRRQGPLGAHHAVFEENLLKSVWAYPPFVPDFLAGTGEVADWGPWLDSRRLAEVLQPGLPSYQLGALIERFDLTGPLGRASQTYCPPGRRRFHAALFDALAAVLLLQRLADLAGPDHPPSLRHWLILSQPPARAAGQTELF